MLKRITIGVTFALLLGFLTFAATKAQTVPEAYDSDDCGNCHETVTAQWENSRHGHASVAETFLAAWAEQGSLPDCLRCHTTGFDLATGTYEKEGVACETCHPSDPAEHPQKIMQTDISSRMCGQCHIDTFAEWETSQHGQEELTCARCHNPHTNELRAGNMQDTCRSCHKEETHFFNYTVHGNEGVLCTDCHLQTKSNPLGNGHGQISHTFTVGTDTCAACHNDDMHIPSEAVMGDSANSDILPASSMSTVAGEMASSNVSPCPYEEDPALMQAGFLTINSSGNESALPEPSTNSPFNFAVMAALIGMAFGLVGSPWLEKWQEKLRNQKDGGSNEQ
jgi:formate-dependent nitrite reductase cytochrome c552 subunit